MKTESKLKIFKGGGYSYVYIYYSINKQILRINTKNPFITNGMTKDQLYKQNVSNYQSLNARTLELKKRVDDYIRTKISSPNPLINQQECLQYIDESNYRRNTNLPVHKYGQYFRIADYLSQNQPQKTEKSVVEHYQDFFDFKKAELRDRVGWKDYKSLQNALLDYQTFHNIKLTFEVMNSEEFLVGFRNFLIDKHDNLVTKGGMNDNTINKRINALKHFWKFLTKRKIFVIDPSLYSFKAPKYDFDVVFLTKAELRQLIEVEVTEKERKLLDIFIAQCLVGLRYSDLSRLNRSHFVIDSEGDYTIEMSNQKTRKKVSIPVHGIAKDIFLKYDFELKVPCNQVYNQNLKKILETHKLFEQTIIKKRIVNSKLTEKKYLKRELITTHTARRTFITNLIGGKIPLNSLMQATGHTKIETVKKYMGSVQDKNDFLSIAI